MHYILLPLWRTNFFFFTCYCFFFLVFYFSLATCKNIFLILIFKTLRRTNFLNNNFKVIASRLSFCVQTSSLVHVDFYLFLRTWTEKNVARNLWIFLVITQVYALFYPCWSICIRVELFCFNSLSHLEGMELMDLPSIDYNQILKIGWNMEMKRVLA